MKLTPVVLALALGGHALCMAEPAKSNTIQTPSGPVTATSRTVEPTPQEIRLASSKEITDIRRLARKADDFVMAYLGAGTGSSLENLDKAFRAWQSEPRRRFSDREVTDTLGAYLGNKLVSDLDMEWVIVMDQDGTDFGVRSKKVEVMAFPFASVAKRIQRSEFDFMVAVFYAIDHHVKNGDVKPR
jgi:Domain of unknown function (DUF3806)